MNIYEPSQCITDFEKGGMACTTIKMISKVVTACANKWTNKGDSNWYTNMYLDYLNNYLTQDRFIENEIEPIIGDEWSGLVYAIVTSLLELSTSISYLQPMLTYEQVGEVAIKILKGEV